MITLHHVETGPDSMALTCGAARSLEAALECEYTRFENKSFA